MKHLWAFPQAACINCLNMWHILIGFTSGQGCRFVFCAPFNLYICQFLLNFSHFIVDLERELVFLRTSLSLFFYILQSFVETVTSPRDCLFGKSSLLFSYHFFCFS